MKAARKTSKNSRKRVPDEYKSIDSSFVPVNNVRLSARTRSQQRNETKAKKISIDQLRDGVSRLAQPKSTFQAPENKNWRITKSVLTYKASKRIESLATPRIVVPKLSDTMSAQTSFQSNVSSKALTYKPTQRILELSRPKGYNNNTITDVIRIFESDESDFFS